MSLPSFPDKENCPSREEAISQIIASIALEELGMSHIINAEGEKIQYALGTIPGVSGPEKPITIEELLQLNKSVNKTLDSTMMNQYFMKEKLVSALSSSTMQGPTGPPGPMTVILGSYETVEQLKNEHDTGNPGDAYLVGGVLYVWDEESNDWKGTGDLTGPTGPQGTGTTIKGSYSTVEEFEQNPPQGSLDDAYLVAGEIYIWNPDDGWHSGGNLQGASTTIKGSYDTLDEFLQDDPEGSLNDAYLVAGEIYIWNPDDGWHSGGNLLGPTGPTGPQGTGTTIKGSYDTLEEFEQNPPPGSPDDAYLVAGEIYIWNPDDGWHSGGSLRGATGPVGPQGTGTTIKGSYDTLEEFEQNPPQGSLDDSYLVAGEIYIWNPDDGWHSGGGLSGPTGPMGPTGPVGTILGSYATVEDLRDAVTEGHQGDMYLIGGKDLYVWNTDTEDWDLMGSLAPTPVSRSIIPFSSGGFFICQTAFATGERNDIAVIGNGGNTSINSPNDPIELPFGILGESQYAFSMPSDGKITAMAVHFTVTVAALTVDTNWTVQLYSATSSPNPPSNSFFPIPGTEITITVPASTASGTYYSDSITIENASVGKDDRIIVVAISRTPGTQASPSIILTGSLMIEI